MKVDDVLYLRSTFQVMTADEIKWLLQGAFFCDCILWILRNKRTCQDRAISGINRLYRLGPEYLKISGTAEFHHAFETVEKVSLAERFFLILCL